MRATIGGRTDPLAIHPIIAAKIIRGYGAFYFSVHFVSSYVLGPPNLGDFFDSFRGGDMRLFSHIVNATTPSYAPFRRIFTD